MPRLRTKGAEGGRVPGGARTERAVRRAGDRLAELGRVHAVGLIGEGHLVCDAGDACARDTTASATAGGASRGGPVVGSDVS